jgi:zinc protease
VFGLPDSYVTEYTSKISAVTKADVRRVARKYLDPGHLTITVVGDRKNNAEPLAKIAPVEDRDLEGDPLPEVKPEAKPEAAKSDSKSDTK